MIRTDFLNISKNIQDMIIFGKYSAAIQQLQSLQIEGHSEKRIQHHLLGRIYLNQGDLSQAEEQLSLATQFGENIHLLMDVASLRYMKGQIYEWRLLCQELERLLKNAAKIHKINVLQAKIFLGKYYEEDGWIIKAHKYYEEAFLEAQKHKNLSGLHGAALLSLTRIKALYGVQKPQLAQCYQQLLSLVGSSLSKTLGAEVQHSLMLAEMHLVGQEHAWFRVKRALDGPQALDGPDQRLIFYDFVFETLVMGRTLPAECLELRPTADLDLFEKNVSEVAFAGKSLFSVDEIQSWVSGLAWNSHLRLLCLALSRELRPNWQKELRQKIDFFISTVDRRSQKIWLNILDHLFEQSRPILNFEVQHKVIRFRTQCVDLSKRKALYSLLDLLASDPSVEIDHALKKLWNLPFSPESFHRLRMTAHRLNEILEKLTGYSKMIDVSTDAVAWRQLIPLKMIQ